MISLPKRNVLLELKIKSDNPDQIEASHAIMASGGIGSRSKALRPTNTVSGVISDGAKQMIEHDLQNDCHHALWLHASGYDAHAHWEQLLFTLYGSQRLVSTERGNMILCYFFHDSEFWRYRKTLAASFVSVWESEGNLSVKLCINPHYSKKHEFRDSEIYTALSNGLLDVEQMEDGQEVFFMDGKCDRKDSRSVIEYLRAKYALNHLQTFDMGYQYAGMWVQQSEDSKGD
ncbi:MAG: hypothetical protein B7Z37_20740 [Verrucomicrobia bacterium 12-59-8]|nr:MAG: hypothetical protein B7Z37_20740 [Verrucomicrobia bacterium 12-59-8]